MFTPQQLNEIGFTKAVFGGYDMDSVHDVLDPLTEDYTALYKENAVLKSKLRILVEKLEEYRQQGPRHAAITPRRRPRPRTTPRRSSATPRTRRRR